MGAETAAIFGCAGTRLLPEEKDFFRDSKPLGFILFARNVETPEQVRRLTDDLRASIGDPGAPILIDQEGGRVQRLKPPHWRQAPSARVLGDLYSRDAEAGMRAIWLNTRLIAADLHPLGIDVDCVPCLDVPVDGAHDVIGKRAYSHDASIVSDCGRIAARALLDGGVLPVAKHMPGHGRAGADTHFDLPVVDASLEALNTSDFIPFRALSDLTLGMTAHIVFSALDDTAPATQSAAVISHMRKDWGFDGLLMTDDLSMKALGGGIHDRAARSIDAGCDVVLHCNGAMDEMTEAAAGAGTIRAEALRRWHAAAVQRRQPEPFDAEAGLRELMALID